MKTYGYDYVFALDCESVNEILATNLAGVVQTMSYQATDPDTGATITIGATFAPWQLVGGQNELLRFNFPISKGSLNITGGPVSGNWDLAGVTPVIELTLGWVGAGDEQEVIGGPAWTSLTWNPLQSASPNNPGYVACPQILDPSNRLTSVASGVLEQLMANAVIANRAEMSYVLANVNPQPSQLAPWLTPVRWQYFWDEAAGANGVLCFLCMLSPTAAFPSQPSFDPSALQPGAGATLLISQPAFFSNVVLPSIRSTFPSGTFNPTTNPDELSTITNSGGFDVGPVAANSYSLAASPAGTGFAVNCSGGGPLKFLFGLADLPDASYSWSISTVNPMTFDGTNISFATDPNPTIHQDQTMHWYDWALIAVLGITTTAGLASAITDLVEKFDNQAQLVGMSTINASLQKATGGAVENIAEIVRWTRSDEAMKATTAGMSESVYVAGNLVVVAPSQLGREVPLRRQVPIHS